MKLIDIDTASTMTDRIRNACRIDGPHWIWAGATSGGTPVIRTDSGTTTTVRRAVVAETLGRPLARNEFAGPGCEVAGCVSPRCCTAGTKGHAVQHAVQRGVYGGALHARRTALAKRARSHISDAAVQRIRTSTRPASEVAAAEAVSASYVYLVRANKTRADLSTPWAGLGERA
jgi:hypothetical protein